MANEIPVNPPDMRKVYLRLKRWRSSHVPRVPIPESLWAAAGELARAHGINPTASPAPGVWQAQAAGGRCGTGGEEARGEGHGRRPAPYTAPRPADVCGTDGTACR
jgi:hypothetical protein